MLDLQERKKVRESVGKKKSVRQEPTWGTNASLMKEVTMVLLPTGPTPSRKRARRGTLSLGYKE